MANIKWLEGNRIQVTPPKKPKKCTGTRFGAVLGVNKWNSPFQAWCAITRTWEDPFTDTIYTRAGKVIEPKQAEYMKRSYGMDILTPTDVYGEDYFKKTWGDFFPKNQIFGGLWDYLGLDENGKVDTVLEMKTTKRSEDWASDIPEYYALQAALYAYLLGVDNVIMVASFLEDSDYEHPENYVPRISNTIPVQFKVSERYPDFAQKVATVTQWWQDHVLTGVSPEYDEKKDAKALAELRTNSVNPDTDITALLEEAEKLRQGLDKVYDSISEQEDRYKQVTDLIKQYAITQFRDGDKKVELKSPSMTFTFTKSNTTSINREALEQDGLLEKYQKVSPRYNLTIK